MCILIGWTMRRSQAALFFPWCASFSPFAEKSTATLKLFSSEWWTARRCRCFRADFITFLTWSQSTGSTKKPCRCQTPSRICFFCAWRLLTVTDVGTRKNFRFSSEPSCHLPRQVDSLWPEMISYCVYQCQQVRSVFHVVYWHELLSSNFGVMVSADDCHVLQRIFMSKLRQWQNTCSSNWWDASGPVCFRCSISSLNADNLSLHWWS